MKILIALIIKVIASIKNKMAVDLFKIRNLEEVYSQNTQPIITLYKAQNKENITILICVS
jgi:hypothetical protein